MIFLREKINLTRLTGVYLLGSFSSKLLSFVAFFIYTYFLTKEDLGKYDLVINLGNAIIPLLTLQITDSLFRWMLESGEDGYKTEIITNTFFVVSCGLLALFCSVSIIMCFYSFSYVLDVVLFYSFQILFVLYQQMARSLGYSAVFAFGGVLQTFLYLIFTSIALVFFDFKLQGILIASCVSYLLTMIYIHFRIKTGQYINWNSINRKRIVELLTYSIPLVPNILSWWAIASSNRFIIIYFLGEEYVADFSVAWKLPSLIYLLSSIFSTAWQEKGIQKYGDDDRNVFYTRTFEKYINVLFGLSFVVLSTIKLSMDVLVSEIYFNSWQFVPMLLLGSIYQALSNFIGVGYLSAKKTKGALFSTLVSAIITITLCFFLIPYFGLQGASFAICAGYVILFSIRLIKTKKYFTIDYNFQKILFFNLYFLIGTLILFTDSIELQILNMVLAVTIAYQLNKNFLKSYLYSKLLIFTKK